MVRNFFTNSGRTGIPRTVLIVLGVVMLGGLVWFVASKGLFGVRLPFTEPPSPVFGRVVSVSPESITIEPIDHTQKTFSISPSTQVVSQVESGQIGKTLSEVEVGAQVSVMPESAGSTRAHRVTISRAPYPLNTDPQGPSVLIGGYVVGTTSAGITVRTGASTTVEVLLDTDTKIVSNVLAGQTAPGREAIKYNQNMQIVAVTTPKGPLAKTIQLLVYLGQ